MYQVSSRQNQFATGQASIKKQGSRIRNFVITAHIDHGKSTLADRFLELTGTVEPRRMRAQYLDQLELERERGITIKMAPVRMLWYPDRAHPRRNPRGSADSEYILNLIDTPGHSDFSYEVSRALAAVEGAILLVDATKGVQAQTLSNFRAARAAGLAIVGAVNKIDTHPPHLEAAIKSLADLLDASPDRVHRVSAKTGAGVRGLLDAVVEQVPPPRTLSGAGNLGRALIFDSLYDDHKGVLAFVRVFDGMFRSGGEARLMAGEKVFSAKEVGMFSPALTPVEALSAGEMGYVATGLKEPALVRIGDTIVSGGRPHESAKRYALAGYKEPSPVVFVSFYPEGEAAFEELHQALERLHLSDPALQFIPESNEALGRGFRIGFLGQLHFEIIAHRLRREFGISFFTSFPSIAYRVREGGIERVIREPHRFPEKPDAVFHPMVRLEITTPPAYLAEVMRLAGKYEAEIHHTENVGDNVAITVRMPLSELLRDFDNQLKTVSSGFASFSYELDGEAPADVAKLEILVAGELVVPLTRVVLKRDLEREGRATVERLREVLPKQQFVQAVQARTHGRIIARETVRALKKNVTGHLYGGDRTRKMKLWKKQKRGKAKLRERGHVAIPPEVFRDILRR